MSGAVYTLRTVDADNIQRKCPEASRALVALLREDARATPEFASARRKAVMVAAERWMTIDAGRILQGCREYESKRTSLGPVVPVDEREYGLEPFIVAAYEQGREAVR